jgi:hypothetical protein
MNASQNNIPQPWEGDTPLISFKLKVQSRKPTLAISLFEGVFLEKLPHGLGGVNLL